MMPSWLWWKHGRTRSLRLPEVHEVWSAMVVEALDSSVIITAIFVGAGLMAYVVIPGLILMWDRVLDAVGENEEGGRKGA
jgi:hypothetical protein